MLHAPDDLRYEPRSLPESIAPNSVRVKLRAVGICGSDVHLYATVSLWSARLVKPSDSKKPQQHTAQPQGLESTVNTATHRSWQLLRLSSNPCCRAVSANSSWSIRWSWVTSLQGKRCHGAGGRRHHSCTRRLRPSTCEAQERCTCKCRDVVAVGSAVNSLAVGDRVALEPGIPCWGNMLPRQALLSPKRLLTHCHKAAAPSSC